jgi:GT2 family glycosyltransferase
VGRFDESLPIYGDELEWERRLERAGHPIVYLPTAVLWHRRTDVRFSTFLKRYFRRGVHYVAFARRVGDSVSVRGSLRTGLLSLAHATRRSCAMGIFMMAQQLGILWALASRRMRGTR